MNHSLITPNQLHHHCIVVNDNPYYHENLLIIDNGIDTNTLLYLQTQGTLIFGMTHTLNEKLYSN
jgi:PhoPQ-activated pathogenicity-related protein